MAEPVKKLMTTIASSISRSVDGAGKAIAEKLDGLVHHVTSSADMFPADDRERSLRFRGKWDSEQEHSVYDQHAVRWAIPDAGKRTARVLYHYTSSEGLAGILDSGKLRSSWGPGNRRGQFLTTIEPGTLPDIALADRLGLSARLSHYIALDVSRLRAKKIVDMGDGNYMIRNRRSLRVNRLLVDAGENPVVLT
ncbi:HYD1 signature containing ADP-ribosyltransferase family protein [Nocardia gipuzkoensis]|uniref:HYD1 signature containing ADP-ribosyltransferase family protein n=1 Tax=Nocardia gipuzkoensis TaxID=2749991 RepID=UPI00237EAE3E|nr:HYD1 signature containing ADP-ribosyltransferase family protein [Nocardia gipuzkoensis]MDE1675490.1 HYD1 signature containing ADP-ribosyltransferase family protein [Nocardia gipuzkoensis]